MDTTIFIKTWYNDLCWLKYCLASIERYFEDPKVVLVADHNCRPHLDYPEVRFVPPSDNGYIQQQIVKLSAHHYTKSDYILFIDSDTVFTEHVSARDFLACGTAGIIHYYEHYSRIESARCWQAPTQAVIGKPVEYEYMRRFPIMHHRTTLERCEEHYPHLISFLQKKRDRNFSEFNLLGAFAHRYNPLFYHWHEITDDNPPPPPVAKQFWSWGGITPEIKEELECTCGTI